MSTDILSTPFERLREGEEFETRGRTVTEADVVGFCQLTGDWHPVHSDAHAAAEGRFGERVAHGMLVLSYAVGLVPMDPGRALTMRRIADAVFKRPVLLGDTIRVRGSVAALQPLDDETGLVTFRWTVVNQSGRTVARARVEVIWSRDDAPPADAAQPSDEGFVPTPL